MNRYPLLQEAGWASAPVWTCAESLEPTTIRSPDRTERLRYPDPRLRVVT